MTDKPLVIIENDDVSELFSKNNEKGITTISNKINDIINNFDYDLSTKSSRSKITTLAFRISKLKTSFNVVGKELSNGARKKVKLINDNKTRLNSELDRLRDLAKQPLTNWTKEEVLRVEKHKDVLRKISLIQFKNYNSISGVNSKEEELITINPNEHEEFADQITEQLDTTLNVLKEHKERIIRENEEKQEKQKLIYENNKLKQQLLEHQEIETFQSVSTKDEEIFIPNEPPVFKEKQTLVNIFLELGLKARLARIVLKEIKNNKIKNIRYIGN